MSQAAPLRSNGPTTVGRNDPGYGVLGPNQGQALLDFTSEQKGDLNFKKGDSYHSKADGE